MKLNPTLSKTLALVAPVTLLTISSTFGASDYYMKIEGINGESTDLKHKDWIELDSFSWGMSNPSAAGSGSGTGMGTGKVSMQDMHFSMKMDKSSPRLMLACATGQHIPRLQFTVSRPDATGGTTDYYVVTLSDVLISSFQTSSAPQPPAGTPRAPESASVKLNFTKIQWTYIAQDNETITVEHDTTLVPPTN